MKLSRKLILVTACLLLAAGAILTTPRKASALWPLAYSWSCSDNRTCEFTVTSTNHATYSWNFGDGSSSGQSSSTTVSHTYNFSGASQNYTVTLLGYGAGSSFPDNMISCTIEAQGPGPGGNPGANGSCSG